MNLLEIVRTFDLAILWLPVFMCLICSTGEPSRVSGGEMHSMSPGLGGGNH